MGKHVQNSSFTPVQQFAADGSVVGNLSARVHPAERLLKQAVWWIDAGHETAGDQTIRNLGWGGSALDAQCGSTGSADSNDPKYLSWEGENYVYLPGVAGNYLSVPDEAALDITGDIDIRVKVAPDQWASGSIADLVSKWYTQYSWLLRLDSLGRLFFYWSSDGSSANFRSLTTPVPLADAAPAWVRVTFDVDDGAGGNVLTGYTSQDGLTWSQFATSTGSGVTSLYPSTAPIHVGTWSTTNTLFTGKVYRAQVLDGINGTPVLDVDCSQITSGSDESFTALTGQTVTINRSTSGRKSVAVTGPVWLFGTDDYMEVADNDLIDFGASDSFTVLAVVRQWATPNAASRWLSKSFDGNFCYEISPNGTAMALYGKVGDNLSDVNAGTALPLAAGGATVATLTVDRPAQLLVVGANNTSQSSSIAAVGSLSTASDLTVGKTSYASNYQDFEGVAFAVFRRALTADEISEITNYYKERIG